MTTWRKSSYSEPGTPDCVELARLDGSVGVRDSKNPDRGQLALARPALKILVRSIKAGELDL